MQDFLDQIRQALSQNLYYVALSMCLIIPDICGAIGSKNGRATHLKYVRWYNRHVGIGMCRFLNGRACYDFRCSMLHQGSTMNPRGRYSRILFLEPGTTTSVFHCNVINDALNLDVGIFCNAMISGAQNWLNSKRSTRLFVRNYGKFLRRYPNGLPPYIVGTPVIG